ncbi:SigB/SigF/SigG family RNA polymerase sigma factor [Streptomyces meridianus]|uniref:SigB/SigF/SigG family RNA polymerase sigma factor n=1 Tax=Streptomyces meridianus TaxID=2938945 RepID=A0ABT0X4B4_9ACTN|nr:SigB/SigF/SigG family RNA polymerase sigma factor [Streptomyces meridianus]MCM2577085.1 SigB/SigF/SigG family RNA polymerase sigma factor [Streptomyces meridianus]
MNLMETAASDAAARDASAPSRDAPVGSEALPEVTDARKVTPGDARDMSKVFFDRLQTLEEGTHEYQYVRNTLIELNLSLVRFAASRYRSRTELREDIIQVGTIGLIKAIDRFDISREVEFNTFALPYITGEIKRFFRDTSWAVHVPRRLQELRLELAKANEKLEALFDRAPTAEELAEYLGITVEEVNEGRLASNGYVAESLDLPAGYDDNGGDAPGLGDRMGSSDPAMEIVENLHALKPLLAGLDQRDRRILELRFGQELTQAQIGAELGISQMHVSRLLTRCLGELREAMTGS